MRHINVGIAFEGGNDDEVIEALLRRIIEPSGYTFDYFQPETPGTMILPYVPIYVRRYLENSVDLGIFCTDQDKSPSSRRRDVEEEIRRVDESFLSKAAIAIPSPHIEAWLLLDDSAIKRILGMDASAPLPHSDLPPKNRLTAIYHEAQDYLKSQNQLRVEIAQIMDIEVCARKDSNFASFLQDIRRAISLFSAR